MTTRDSQQVSISTLATLFGSSARAAVLRLFMLDPYRAYYQRQIEAATGLPIRAVQRELERLKSIALVYRYAEGNRTYYQIDPHFPLFPELRTMMLKTVGPADRLRGVLAAEKEVRLAFLSDSEGRVLLVTGGGASPEADLPPVYETHVMTIEEFLAVLSERSAMLDPYLVKGTDLLGRREDMLWRRIEAAGYTVAKGKGVA